MKIAFYSSYPHFAGSQKMALQICEQMASRGHETIALAPDETAYIQKARAKGQDAQVIKAPKAMLDFGGGLKNAGTYGKLHFMLLGLAPFTIRALLFLKKHKPDVIYAAQPRAALEIGVAAKLLGIPLVFHIQSGLQKKLMRLYKLGDQLSSHIVSVSHAIADDIKDGLGQKAAAKTTVIYNGLQDLYMNDDVPKTSNIKTTLLFLGTYVPEKGLHHLIEAFAKIPEDQRKNMVLEAAGLTTDEAYHAYISTRTRELGLQEQVFLLGFRDDVPALIDDADIIVTPSVEDEELVIGEETRVVNWKEGFCLAALEAMRAAKPVIASKTYGLSEVVIDQETGLHVPPSNQEALTKAIMELSENKHMRSTFGQAGRARFENVFSLKKMSDDFEAVFEKTLNRL